MKKIDMSPRAIENRLKLVGELTKACLMIRRNSLERKEKISDTANKNEVTSADLLKRRTSRVK